MNPPYRPQVVAATDQQAGITHLTGPELQALYDRLVGHAPGTHEALAAERANREKAELALYGWKQSRRNDPQNP